ncbi:hypothetical protein MMC30_002549 [Trapelia coarctata]|nr:hypothetical protein [Trapelia coarctata]
MTTLGYATPESLIAMSITLPTLGLVAVALRFYTRHGQKARLMLDDWLILPAWGMSCICGGVLIWGSLDGGLGRPLPSPNVPGPDGYKTAFSDRQLYLEKAQYAYEAVEPLALGLVKLSILFFYRRIFCTPGPRSYNIAINTIIVIVICWAVTFEFAAIFQCGRNIPIAWGTILANESCVQETVLLGAYVLSDVLTDIIILCTPLPMVWALHMAIQSKIAVIGVFLVGTLALAASIAKMGITIAVATNLFSPDDEDPIITAILYWSMIEIGIGVIVACLPSLWPLIRRLSPSSMPSKFRSAFSFSFSARSNRLRSSRSNPSAVRLRSFDNQSNSGVGLACEGEEAFGGRGLDVEKGEGKVPEGKIRVEVDVDVRRVV